MVDTGLVESVEIQCCAGLYFSVGLREHTAGCMFWKERVVWTSQH